MTFEEADQKYCELRGPKGSDMSCHFIALYWGGEYEQAATEIEQRIGCDHDIALKLVKKYSKGIPVIKSDPNAVNATPRYVPKCPTCGSPNIRRITEIFSYNPRQFKCNNCGYKW